MNAGFQRAFVDALFEPDEDALPELSRQPAFAIYRNTVMKACIDALEANFPSVTRLVGRDWFRAAAAVYVAEAPPDDPRLLFYGQGFPAFLARFEPAARLPYLPEVAVLDWSWVASHVSADALPLDAAALASLSPQEIGALCLLPHPAARWHWCADHPAFTIWSHNRADGEPLPDELAWQAEGALITRPGDTVQWHVLDKAGHAFLDACACGLPLAEAAQSAIAADTHADIAGLLAMLLRQGAFRTRTDIPKETSS